MKEALLNRPWLLIIAGYVLAMSAWIVMVMLAVRYRDPDVPVVTTVERP
jgi:hypothetical protein